jgi:hypothetical protein
VVPIHGDEVSLTGVGGGRSKYEVGGGIGYVYDCDDFSHECRYAVKLMGGERHVKVAMGWGQVKQTPHCICPKNLISAGDQVARWEGAEVVVEDMIPQRQKGAFS